MGFAKLLKTVRKLNRIGRWSTEYMTEDVRPTIASHSFTTTQVAQLLGVIEEQHGNIIDWKNLYEKAINHDTLEAITGDILSHVKNHNPEMKRLVLQIEEALAQQELFDSLPAEYVERYKEILFNGKDNTPEGKILEAADAIDLIIECINEIRRNNPEEVFREQYVDKIIKLQSIDLVSVDYFLENILIGEFLVNMQELRDFTRTILKNTGN